MLDFLVLLRGEPGWFLPAKSSSVYVSGPSLEINGEQREFHQTSSVLEFAVDDRTLRLQYDPAALTLTIQTEVVSLQAANVVLGELVTASKTPARL